MEDKSQAYFQLNHNYRDEYGRVTLSPAVFYPSKEGKFENNNMHLSTGESAILLHKSGLLMGRDIKATIDSHMVTQVVPGLFSRHPEPYVLSMRNVSHDEYNGIMYSASVIPELRETICNDIVEYGHENNWIFYDKDPNNENLTITDLDSLQDNYLRFMRQPRDRAYYKIMSTKYKPRFFEVMNLAIATMLTTRDQSYEESGGSTMVMVLYKIWSLENIGYKSKMMKLASWFFKRSLKKRLGADWVYELHKRYFDRDENHPFLTLCKNLE